MKSPRWVGEMGSGNRAEVCAASGDDGVHMIAFEDISHGDGGNADLVANAIGKRHLEHTAVHGLFRFAYLAG